MAAAEDWIGSVCCLWVVVIVAVAAIVVHNSGFGMVLAVAVVVVVHLLERLVEPSIWSNASIAFCYRIFDLPPSSSSL